MRAFSSASRLRHSPATGSADKVWPPIPTIRVASDRLRPTMRTSYTRTTYLLPASGSRVTVDRELRWESASSFVRAVGLLILETKTAPGSTADLDRALWSLGHRPVRLSEYITGLSILNPDLPGNKWHRLAEPLRAAVNSY